jgi:hypothetical protein
MAYLGLQAQAAFTLAAGAVGSGIQYVGSKRFGRSWTWRSSRDSHRPETLLKYPISTRPTQSRTSSSFLGADAIGSHSSIHPVPCKSIVNGQARGIAPEVKT